MSEVYRCYDEHGVLLYVGMSKCAMTRLHGHRHTSWASAVARVEVQKCADEASARAAERVAIREEKPHYNVMMNPEVLALRYGPSPGLDVGGLDDDEGEDLIALLHRVVARLAAMSTNEMKAVAALTKSPAVSWQAIYKIARGATADPGILTLGSIREALGEPP